MSKKRQYKRYTQEFKEEAVALVVEQGYSVSQAATSLGINANMLYKWRDQLEAQRAANPLVEDEREELKRLRKETKRLRMEQEILKKASAFFAQQMK